MKKSILILLFFLGHFYCNAFTLKGTVIDINTGETIIGAIISIDSLNKKTSTGLDGTFVIQNIQEGKYKLKIKYLSYELLEEYIYINSNMDLKFSLKPSNLHVQEIIITAEKDEGAEHKARNIEKNSMNVVNIVSAKEIEVSPDITVANVVQRVSGISIERNDNGDGQHAIVRGMDKRYNYTLVNGVKIPSPDNKNRYVPLDIFPAELLDRLEVSKSLTPSMEGDAVGGVVNLVMKDAPNNFYCVGNIATGYSEIFVNKPFMAYGHDNLNFSSPYELNGKDYTATLNDFAKDRISYKSITPNPNLIASVAIGNRYFKKKLGFIVAASIQNTFRGANSSFYEADLVGTELTSTLFSRSDRLFSNQQNRSGIHTKLDFKFNKRHKIQLYTAYMKLSEFQTRDMTTLNLGTYIDSTGSGTIKKNIRTRLTQQQIYNNTLHGEHVLIENLKIDWSGVYSFATNYQPDNTTLSMYGVRENFRDRLTNCESVVRTWAHNSDIDVAFYGNITYNLKFNENKLELKSGGLIRNKNRDNFFNSYRFLPVAPFEVYGVDYESYTDIELSLKNPKGSAANALTYSATEYIRAGYLQAKLDIKNIEILGGARYETTDQGYKMKFPAGEPIPEGNQVYADLLPSVNIKYKVLKNHNIRGGYFKSINRPGFFEIVPFRIVNEDYNERGNPNLQRAIAQNFDLRYEYFPKPLDQYMAGIFYKSIQNPIEYTLQKDPARPQDIIYVPGNFGTAINYGAELNIIKYIRNFGFKFNYTFTNSNIVTSKSQRVRDENGNLKLITVNQSRPLYGQSAHIGNITFIYKNTNKGIDAQIAISYTGERINTVSQFIDNDLWQAPITQADISIEKSIKSRWKVFVKANNIFNAPLKVYVKNTNPSNNNVPHTVENGNTIVKSDYYFSSFILGIKFKL